MEIINLDMTPSTVTPNAHAGQYDASRTVRFMLKNGGVPFTLAGTETITAEITRSDGTEVTVNVANTSSNYVDVVFDDTVCTVKGLYACELRLKDSGGFDIGSKNFALLVQRDPYDGAGVVVETVGPADICTFETTLPEPLQSILVNVVATGGNGTPDNPNPIVGYSSANITRCGVNLFDKTEVIDGYIIDSTGEYRTSDSRKCTDFIAIKGGETYKILSEQTDSSGGAWYDSEKNYISACAGYYVGGSTVKTAPANACYVRLTVWSNSSGNIDTFGLNYPATDTTYHPYNGQTYTIAFGQTVYGGQLDVTRGKLHVTWGIVDLGVLIWRYQSGNTRFYTDSIISVIKGGTENILCSIYSVGNTVNDNYSMQIASNGYFYVKNTNYTDAQTFKTAMDGIILAYELATPFDIDLTPEVISAIVGENNVFGDCGQSTVKYLKVEA